MWFLTNKKIPKEAKNTLQKYGEVICFYAKNETTLPLAGHVDIFMCQYQNTVVLAPNTPKSIISILNNNNVNIVMGNKPVTHNHPDTILYNCLITKDFVIGNIKHLDKHVLDTYADKKQIHVSQGYMRCNTISIDNKAFVTSDAATYKVLSTFADVCFVDSQQIILTGYKYGFFGGCCGFASKKLFVCGNISQNPNYTELNLFVNKYGIKIIDLMQTTDIYDIGSIFCFDKKIIY